MAFRSIICVARYLSESFGIGMGVDISPEWIESVNIWGKGKRRGKMEQFLLQNKSQTLFFTNVSLCRAILFQEIRESQCGSKCTE